MRRLWKSDWRPVRNLSIALILGLTLAALTACGGSGKTTLLVYTPHGPELLKEFEKRFEAANPTIDVQFQDLASQDILNRLTLERANPQADVWWGASSLTFDLGVQEGVLEAYKPTWGGLVKPTMHDAQDRWYATYLTPEVIVYNKELVPETEAPKDWDDLLGERWQGKVLIRQPLQSDTMRTIFGAMILRFWATTNGPQGGYDWLKKLDANTKDYTTDGTQLMQKIGRGEGLVTLWNLPDVILHQQKNLPLAFRYPESGTPIVTDGIGIVKGTRNLEAAKRFYEFVTTPESLIFAANQFARVPVRRSDINLNQLPESMRTDIKELPMDYTLLQKEVKNWMQHWENNIRKRS